MLLSSVSPSLHPALTLPPTSLSCQKRSWLLALQQVHPLRDVQLVLVLLLPAEQPAPPAHPGTSPACMHSHPAADSPRAHSQHLAVRAEWALGASRCVGAHHCEQHVAAAHCKEQRGALHVAPRVGIGQWAMVPLACSTRGRCDGTCIGKGRTMKASDKRHATASLMTMATPPTRHWCWDSGYQNYKQTSRDQNYMVSRLRHQ